MTCTASRSALLGLLLLPTATPFAFARSTPIETEELKGPTCGCCKDWIPVMSVRE
ncbi:MULTISPECIES: hypothetical protein [unclassified Comamonas]|uniref:hypothetical protein n=1 Tax=unclassified Comamonas TaxID=2638500 RepID=UPI001AD2CB05|nr:MULTISPECIES: hypothetical protein [unclassified Comamonas]MBN9331630.1 hypothetical protein [Comamonas sp.]